MAIENPGFSSAASQTSALKNPGLCPIPHPHLPPLIKPFYDRYCLNVLPWIGQFVAKDKGAYQYLAESIQQFPTQPMLAKRMEKAGFNQVKWLNLTGGIAVIHEGWKV